MPTFTSSPSVATDSSPELSNVMDGVGGDDFAPRLGAYLHGACGADHCAVFSIQPQSIQLVASHSLDGTRLACTRGALYVTGQYWREDPAMSRVKQSIRQDVSTLIRVDVRSLPREVRSTLWPNICERMLRGKGPLSHSGHRYSAI